MRICRSWAVAFAGSNESTGLPLRRRATNVIVTAPKSTTIRCTSCLPAKRSTRVTSVRPGRDWSGLVVDDLAFPDVETEGADVGLVEPVDELGLAGLRCLAPVW